MTGDGVPPTVRYELSDPGTWPAVLPLDLGSPTETQRLRTALARAMEDHRGPSHPSPWPATPCALCLEARALLADA